MVGDRDGEVEGNGDGICELKIDCVGCEEVLPAMSSSSLLNVELKEQANHERKRNETHLRENVRNKN